MRYGRPVSDSWYRDPVALPAFLGDNGQPLCWFDGCEFGWPPPPPVPDWMATWPEDLQGLAFEAAFVMDIAEEYRRQIERLCE